MNVKQRVQNFWTYFMQNKNDLESAIHEHQTQDVKYRIEDMNEKLKDICACKIEIEESETGFFELTFDTAGNKTSQLIAALLKKDACKELSEDWIINAFRQPLSEKAMNIVLEMNGKQYRGADFKVYYTIDDIRKTLALEVYCDGLNHVEEERRQSIVAYMLELFLGELEFEARISHVTILEEDSGGDDVCLLPNLYEDICDIIMDREWIEYHDPLSIYVAYKLDEKPKSETLRNDRKLIITTNSQLQEELMNKQFDSCKEMKALGGEYGYLYYEVLYEDEKEALVRQQLEKEINDLLYPLSIARTMGGAVGEHYSYIDLAIFDIEAFKIACKKMNEKMNFTIYYKAFI